MTDADDAMKFHLSTRHSTALVTLDLSGFLAGRKGHGASQNPFASGSYYCPAPRRVRRR